MIIGAVTEIKNHEYRVGLTPNCVSEYVSAGHKAFVQSGAGKGSGFSDAEYIKNGADIIENARDVWEQSDIIVKVKEPVEAEYAYLRKNLILYTYLHLAANRMLTQALIDSKTKAVAYETISGSNNELPCLRPMSAIAGRLSIQEGSKYLEKQFGGSGILLGGITGVEKANVIIVGGGTVGLNACKMVYGLNGNVTVLDTNLERLSYIDDIFGGKITTLYSSNANIETCIKNADLIIGAVLIPGKAAPRLIRRQHLKLMKKGTVLVDVAVDQGGCFETTKPTTHEKPTYIVDNVVPYCVANMPGAVPRTATIALTNSTLKYGLMIANYGLENAAKRDLGLAKGVNCYRGNITCEGVAEAMGYESILLKHLIQ